MEINAYAWVLWLHVLSSLVFFFVHGTTLAIAFRLPAEKSTDGMRALLNITGMTTPYLFGSLLLLQAFGIALAFMSTWWMQAWPWISFVLLNSMTVWMTWYGRKIYSPLRKALGLPFMTGVAKENRAVEPASMEDVQELLRKADPRLQAWMGLGVSATVLWLMLFRPF